MKVNIYFRHTDISRATINGRPDWFSHEACFRNLISTIERSKFNSNVIFNFIFDGNPDILDSEPLYKLFKNSLLCNKKIHVINGGDQRKAWRACIDIVSSDIRNMESSDLIYLLENDYVHLHNWLDELNSLNNSLINWDVISLYDHPDKYHEYCEHIDAEKNKNPKSCVYFTGTHHWKLAPSTCATYIMRADMFDKLKTILSMGIYDYKLFFILTKILRRKLISPIPSLSTHSMASLLAPAIDWSSVISGKE